MPVELAIRTATPEDMPDILDLMRLSLGEGNIPRRGEYWRWKHVDNPFGQSPTLLAFSDDKLVGLRVFMRWTWRAGSRDVGAVRAVDTATHPDFQGRGIFSRLTLALVEKVRAEGTSFVFNTPNEKSRPGYLKMGWVSLGRSSLWLRPITRALAGALLKLRRRSDEPLGDPAIELLSDPGLARFCAALPVTGERFRTVPTPEYLRWRYVSSPAFDYRAVWELDGDEGAVVIFRAKDDGRLPELRLCQVLAGPGARSQKMGRGLIRWLASRSSAHFASAMTSSGTASQRLLVRSGFLPAPRLGPVMTVRPLATQNGGLDPLRRADWDLSIGDLELF